MPRQTGSQGSDVKKLDGCGSSCGNSELFDSPGNNTTRLEFAKPKNTVVHKPAFYNVDELIVTARIGG